MDSVLVCQIGQGSRNMQQENLGDKKQALEALSIEEQFKTI